MITIAHKVSVWVVHVEGEEADAIVGSADDAVAFARSAYSPDAFETEVSLYQLDAAGWSKRSCRPWHVPERLAPAEVPVAVVVAHAGARWATVSRLVRERASLGVGGAELRSSLERALCATSEAAARLLELPDAVPPHLRPGCPTLAAYAARHAPAAPCSPA